MHAASHNRSWPLTGRDEELAMATAAVRGGDLGVVVAGGSGVGKTRLLREALGAAAARGTATRWIAASRSARRLPLGAFGEIAPDRVTDPLRAVHAVVDSLTGDRFGRPVVVGIDDAHLLDDLSALVVHHLATRRGTRLVVTVCSGEHAPDVVTALWKNEQCGRLELQPLSAENVRDLVEAVLAGPLDSRTARRLWAMTHGNALYLRRLVEDQLAAGRLHRVAGVWRWDGDPVISPGLRELVAARLDELPPGADAVVEVLAHCEALDADLLAEAVTRDDVEEAERRGVVVIDDVDGRRQARLAHPLLGVVHNSRGGRFRRAGTCGRVARCLERGGLDGDDVLTHAAFRLDSDLPPDHQVFVDGCRAAIRRHRFDLAARLAEAALRCSGDVEAGVLSAVTQTMAGRYDVAHRTLARAGWAQTASARAATAGIGLWITGGALIDNSVPDSLGYAPQAVRASSAALAGAPVPAITLAEHALAGPLGDVDRVIAVLALTVSFGDSGQYGAMWDAAATIRHSHHMGAETTLWTAVLGVALLAGLRASGDLNRMTDLAAAAAAADAIDAPGLMCALGSMTFGAVKLAAGHLHPAVRLLRDAEAELHATESTPSIWRVLNLAWLAEALGKLGQANLARETVDRLDDLVDPAMPAYPETACALARAWASAAEGAVTEAQHLARAAAAAARQRGQRGNEVLCLQTATQFGDTTTASRVAELTAAVEGPRAQVAAAHAAALTARATAALIDASQRYEQMGDLVAAADAAGQAAATAASSGHRGQALTVAAIARRLVHECGGAVTPATRTVSGSTPFTGRQREIIDLAATGMSNKDIAVRLVMSIRTVEGHLYKASQRVGAGNRDELIAIRRGQHTRDSGYTRGDFPLNRLSRQVHVGPPPMVHHHLADA